VFSSRAVGAKDEQQRPGTVALSDGFSTPRQHNIRETYLNLRGGGAEESDEDGFGPAEVELGELSRHETP
jgi:hypothetical protein